MLLTLNIRYKRVSDIVIPDHLVTDPSVPLAAYRDGFGNWCTRIVAPQGRIRLFADAVVRGQRAARHRRTRRPAAPRAGSAGGDPGLPAGKPVLRDRPAVRDGVVAVRDGAAGLGARARSLRLRAPAPRLRLPHARSTKTACAAFNDGNGVCRDYADLAIAFCRHVRRVAAARDEHPADARHRCCEHRTYTSVPPSPDPMDFSA